MPTRASRITFFAIFAITGFLFYRTMRPLFLSVGLAAFCAVLSWAPYSALARALGGRRRLAAGLCTAGVYCHRASGFGAFPRKEIAALPRALEDLAGEKGRPLTRWLPTRRR